MLNGAAEAEPCCEWDAARGLLWYVGEIENDQAKASAFKEKIGGAEDLLEAVFGVFSVSRNFGRIGRTETNETGCHTSGRDCQKWGFSTERSRRGSPHAQFSARFLPPPEKQLRSACPHA